MSLDGLFVNSLVCSLVSFMMSGMNDNEFVVVVENKFIMQGGAGLWRS